jgi:geranylgeranyl reductase family protein
MGKNHKETKYDVVVVGAGPAGLQCTLELAKAGVKVLLVEKQKEIGEPNYSTAGTPEETIKDFNLPSDVAPYECDTLYFKSPNREHSFQLKKHRCYVLDFRKLRQWLAKEVSKSGGEISLCTEVQDLIIKDNKVVGVKYQGLVSSGIIESKIVIDATGIVGILSNKLNIFDAKKTVHTLAAELEMTNVNLPVKNALCFYIGDDYVPNGYAWIFPLSDSIAKIGLARVIDFDRKIDFNLSLKKFIEKITRLEHSQPLEFHIGSFPSNYTDNYVRNGYIVIGSAAGQLNPIAGEGIRHALKSGRIAAQVVKEALDKDDTSKNSLSEFNNLWRNFAVDDWQLCHKLAYHFYNNTGNRRVDSFIDDFTQLSGDELYEIFFNYDLKKHLTKVTGIIALNKFNKIKDTFIKR